MIWIGAGVIIAILVVMYLVYEEWNHADTKGEKSSHTWCWKCGTEHGEAAFVRDCYITPDGHPTRNVVHFHCPECDADSYFDYDAPVPLIISRHEVWVQEYKRQYENK